jgi:hypothetical protein
VNDETIMRTPPNLLQFLGMEEQQLLVSLAKMQEEMGYIAQLEGLYGAATSYKEVREDDYVVFQLLTFTHYHFLFTLVCQMRCHLSEAFGSARAAIDAALVAAYIIKDRAAQVAYVKREAPFDNYYRYLGNLRRDGKPLPHPLMGTLIAQHKTISSFATHADVGSFIHRVRDTKDESGNRMLAMEYFQFARDDDERKLHTLTLLHTFVMILDVFAEFLIDEQKAVPDAWKEQLHRLGAAIERLAGELREKIKAVNAEGGGKLGIIT